MSRGHGWTFFQGRRVDGWQTHKKMINIVNHQVLVRIWKKGNLHTLLVGMLTGMATCGRQCEDSRKLRIELPYDPIIPLLGIYLGKKNKNTNSKRYMHPNVCGIIAYSCQDTEATNDRSVRQQMSGWRRYTYTRCNITQPWKGVRFCHLQQHGWTWRVSC